MVSGSLINLPQLTVEQAEHWIAAALAEEKALRQHDHQLYPETGNDSTTRAAEQLHAAWKRWADDAEALLKQVAPLTQGKAHVAGAHDLDYAVGRARAMLNLSPQEMQSRREKLRHGDFKTGEEVRRELRDPARR